MTSAFLSNLRSADGRVVGALSQGESRCHNGGAMTDAPTSPLSENDKTEAVRETGAAVIARICKTLPNRPGVYRMLDRHGKVLYVGKARSLAKRVASYTRLTGHSQRIARMIHATADMVVVTTRTESEALLLEANLIKRYKPRYNILLRDDKAFPYILIADDHEAPQLVKHRGARKRKGDYFGPFASAGAVNRTLTTLQRAFLLRTCSDAVYESRTRPCLLYQIKRCSAPCTGEISLSDYRALVEETRRFLQGKNDSVKRHLLSLMEAASERLDFEEAAVYRDRLAALAQIQAHQGINPRTLAEADVFALHGEAGQICIQVFFFRHGQNWGNRAYFPRAHSADSPEEVLGAFVAQFYDNKPCPRHILLSHPVPDQALLAEALGARAGHKVTLTVPKRGEKRELVVQAQTNAAEALARRLAGEASQRQILADLASRLGLPHPPRRIEVFDNSHIQGTHAVGAMIVAGPEGFLKAHYRKFNIRGKDMAPGDDFAMMREVFSRRFRNMPSADLDSPENSPAQDETDKDETVPQWPDLVIIDGGAGQLSAAREVLAELGLPPDRPRLMAVAKGPERNAGRERLFLTGRDPIQLPPRDPVLYYIQRLRDEAHRFAIGAHRTRRRRAIGATPLDSVPGVGPTRKRALLRHFGSAKAVSRAGVADLAKVPGISRQLAQTIHDFFHEGEV